MSASGFADYLPRQGAAHPSRARVAIRPAMPADIPAMLDVQKASGRAVPAGEALARTVHDDARLVVVAETDGGVVGWGKTHFWPESDGTAPSGHYLGGVTVDPMWRRRGIGAALTQARLEWIWQRAADAWYVVNVANRASIVLHSRWGFVETARAPRFHTTEFTGGVGLLMRASRP